MLHRGKSGSRAASTAGTAIGMRRRGLFNETRYRNRGDRARNLPGPFGRRFYPERSFPVPYVGAVFLAGHVVVLLRNTRLETAPASADDKSVWVAHHLRRRGHAGRKASPLPSEPMTGLIFPIFRRRLSSGSAARGRARRSLGRAELDSGHCGDRRQSYEGHDVTKSEPLRQEGI